ncbi:MAG: helix-turn-helix transcriptional regulator [Lachnospiraceae bacterium]|nr:helix-turn-helix transcriptional regulator [Lachnospiraceae bacterium]
MFVLDSDKMKKYVELSGIKQKAISEKSGLSESALSLILQGKRRCEIGEYATICEVLGVNTDKFLKPRTPV